MPCRLELIPAGDDARWSEWLAPVRHTFHHTAAYHRFSAQAGEGAGFLAVAGGRSRYMAWPWLERPLLRDAASPAARPSAACDLTSVYGYGGPLAFGCAPGDSFLLRARCAIAGLWRELGAVSVFTRFHPLLENHRWTAPAPAGFPGAAAGSGPEAAGGWSISGVTVSIDLAGGNPWSGYQPSLRNRIHRGRRLGLVTEPDPAWDHLAEFYSCYRATMQRNHAAPQYWFSLDYFRALRDALKPHAFLMRTRLGGETAAAGIFVEHGGMVENQFTMNHENFLELSPAKVLLDDVRLWAAARGNRAFHLGGGRGGSCDSLFQFKAAFSPRRHAFCTGRWIADPGAYRDLCRSTPHASPDFFPAYRAPARHAPFSPSPATSPGGQAGAAPVRAPGISPARLSGSTEASPVNT